MAFPESGEGSFNASHELPDIYLVLTAGCMTTRYITLGGRRRPSVWDMLQWRKGEEAVIQMSLIDDREVYEPTDVGVMDDGPLSGGRRV